MLLTRRQVAAKLRYSHSYFSKNWRGWRRTLGFPGPVVGARWDAETLDAWIRQRGAQPPEPEPPPRGGRPRLLDRDASIRAANRHLDKLT